MAIFQTDHAKGLIQPPRPLSAGVRHLVRFRYVFSTAFAFATDKLELGPIPTWCRISGMTLIGETATATNATIGWMSGTPGDPDNARTVGAEFFSAQAVNNTISTPTLVTAFRQAAQEATRALGLTLSADVTASASKVIELLVTYEA